MLLIVVTVKWDFERTQHDVRDGTQRRSNFTKGINCQHD